MSEAAVPLPLLGVRTNLRDQCRALLQVVDSWRKTQPPLRLPPPTTGTNSAGAGTCITQYRLQLWLAIQLDFLAIRVRVQLIGHL